MNRRSTLLRCLVGCVHSLIDLGIEKLLCYALLRSSDAMALTRDRATEEQDETGEAVMMVVYFGVID